MHSTSCRRSVSVVAMTFLKGALISTLAYLGTPSGSAMALAYSFTTIDVPGAFVTSPTGVNDSGEIVGNFVDVTGRHGFLYKDGTFSTLGPPGALQSFPSDINNAGHIVGSFTDSAGQHGFLNVGGAFMTIDFPGAISTSALAIDNAGRILGISNSPTDSSYFIANGSNFVTLPALANLVVNDFNDSGRVVGMGGDEHFGSGFVMDLDGGNFDELVYPGSTRTEASGINNAGQIVGTFYDIIKVDDDGFFICCFPRGFVNVGGTFGTFIPLDHPDAIPTVDILIGTQAFKISDSGLIVGHFYDQENKVYGFLATPTVPEPASLMLLGVGLWGLSRMRRHRLCRQVKNLRGCGYTGGKAT